MKIQKLLVQSHGLLPINEQARLGVYPELAKEMLKPVPNAKKNPITKAEAVTRAALASLMVTGIHVLQDNIHYKVPPGGDTSTIASEIVHRFDLNA